MCPKDAAATPFNCFKLLVISLLLSLVSSASDGYRLQFIDSGKRDQKIYQRFAMKFWTTVPTSDPGSLSIEPLDAVEIGALPPAKAQVILTVARKSALLELPF